MVARLDLRVQEVVGQEAEGEEAAVFFAVEQFHRVDDLAVRDVDVDGSEVGGEAVADEDAATVEEEPEFLVHHLERFERVLRPSRVEVTGRQARVSRDVVDDGLVDGDVIVEKGYAFVRAAASQDRYSTRAETSRPDDFTLPIDFDLDLLTSEVYEFCIQRNVEAWFWHFGFESEWYANAFGFKMAVTH